MVHLSGQVRLKRGSISHPERKTETQGCAQEQAEEEAKHGVGHGGPLWTGATSPA